MQHSLLHFHEQNRKFHWMMRCAYLVRQKQDGSFHLSRDLSNAIDGVAWVSICHQITTPFYCIRNISCLVYILTDRWGSVLLKRNMCLPLCDIHIYSLIKTLLKPSPFGIYYLHKVWCGFHWAMCRNKLYIIYLLSVFISLAFFIMNIWYNFHTPMCKYVFF